ncbi:MAG: hypothetical protein N3Z29_01645 [Synechococcaceae cyanobacterium MAG-AL1]|nr:hypothetical protein [Candidatus Regnicoccus frigidus MAG-AL1]
MDWPTAAELLQRPPADPATHPDAAAAELRWLGRFGRVEALRQRAPALRSSPSWNARWALELALALRLAGEAREADERILEADRLEPNLGLLPDPWGLWPAPAASGQQPAHAGLAGELLQQLRTWRWLDAAALEQSWLASASGSWQEGLSEPALDQLALLLHHGDGRSDAFRPLLIQLVGDAEMAAHPAAAAGFWAFVADADPSWDYAVIKAADQALQRGQQQRCAAWLHEPSGALAANPWCHDLAARLALADNRISEALQHWGEAIARCSNDGAAGQPELVEVFRQRRREARRGPAVLHARALLQRGEAAQARELLLHLVEQDPQWQPLRALLAQTERAAVSAEPAGPINPAEPEAQLRHFQAFLARIATQHDLPLAALESTPAGTLDSQRQRLEAFAASLVLAEGQLALRS